MTELGDLGTALSAAMERLFRLRGVLDPAAVAHGLGMSISEAMALGHLARGRCSQSDLRRHLALERSTVSRLVDAMVARDWVQRSTTQENLRERVLVLTPVGRSAAADLARAMRARHEAMVAALTEEERAALAVALPALLRVVGATGPGGPGAPTT